MRPTTPAKGPAAFDHQARGDVTVLRLDRAHTLRVLPDPRGPGVQQKTRCAPLGKAVRRRMAGELAVTLAEGGSHGSLRDVRKARVNLGRGQKLRIGHPQRMMLGDRRLHAIHHARLIGDEQIACVAHGDIVVGDADELGEVFVEADALLRQVGHRRLGELQPERLNGLGGSQAAQIAPHLQQHGVQYRRAKAKTPSQRRRSRRRSPRRPRWPARSRPWA